MCVQEPLARARSCMASPVGLPAPSRTIFALAEAPAICERPFSEDALENVLGGLAWEHISYQDGPAGGGASSSPAISQIRPITVLPESRVIERSLSWRCLAHSDYRLDLALSLHYSVGKQTLFFTMQYIAFLGSL